VCATINGEKEGSGGKEQLLQRLGGIDTPAFTMLIILSCLIFELGRSRIAEW